MRVLLLIKARNQPVKLAPCNFILRLLGLCTTEQPCNFILRLLGLCTTKQRWVDLVYVPVPARSLHALQEHQRQCQRYRRMHRMRQGGRGDKIVHTLD